MSHQAMRNDNWQNQERQAAGIDPWKVWDAYYRSLSPTGQPPERRRMIMELPKKPRHKLSKRQKDEKKMWEAFARALRLQGQMTRAIAQQQET